MLDRLFGSLLVALLRSLTLPMIASGMTRFGVSRGCRYPELTGGRFSGFWGAIAYPEGILFGDVDLTLEKVKCSF